DGKFNHFAEFEIIGGKLLPDGKYQRPTVTLLCNFPPATADKPSLLSHNEVETLFHEFGHVLHTITTHAKYARFAGTHVPTDCVAISNPILEKVFLPIDPSTTFVSYFGHLNGYDAGYYGYAWADAIAADMATVFESAPDGYFDRQAGVRLRNEIYAMGDSR